MAHDREEPYHHRAGKQQCPHYGKVDKSEQCKQNNAADRGAYPPKTRRGAEFYAGKQQERKERRKEPQVIPLADKVDRTVGKGRKRDDRTSEDNRDKLKDRRRRESPQNGSGEHPRGAQGAEEGKRQQVHDRRQRDKYERIGLDAKTANGSGTVEREERRHGIDQGQEPHRERDIKSVRADEVAGAAAYHKQDRGYEESNRKRGHLGKLEREPLRRDNEHQSEYQPREERVARPLNKS